MRSAISWLVLFVGLASGIAFGADPAVEKARAAAAAVRQQVAEVLKIDARTPEGEARLLELVLDEEAAFEVRVNAVKSLGRAAVSSSAVQVGVLSLVSNDVDEDVRMAAMEVLYPLGVPAGKAVPKLIEVLENIRVKPSFDKSPDPTSAALAAMILAEYGPAAKEAIPALVWSIHSMNSHPVARSIGEYALGRIAPDEFPHFTSGREAVEQAINLLSSPVAGERRFAADRLLMLPNTHAVRESDVDDLLATAIPLLKQNLEHRNRDVQLTSAAALLSLSADDEATALFEAAIESRDAFECRQIFEWLTRYELDFDGTRLYYNSLKATDARVRLKAASRLVNTPHEQEAFDLVKEHCAKEQFRGEAISALGVFPSEMIEPLRPMLEKLAPERNTGGYRARVILKEKFGLVIEPKDEKRPTTAS